MPQTYDKDIERLRKLKPIPEVKKFPEADITPMPHWEKWEDRPKPPPGERPKTVSIYPGPTKGLQPSAQERHLRTPIYREELGPHRLGKWERYDEGSPFFKERGKEAISISPDIPEGSPEDVLAGKDRYSEALRHEIGHGIQAFAEDKGKNISPDLAEYDKPWRSEFWTRKHLAPEYYKRQAREVGPQHADVYNATRTSHMTRGLPSDPELEDSLNENQLEQLDKQGLSKFKKVFKKR